MGFLLTKLSHIKIFQNRIIYTVRRKCCSVSEFRGHICSSQMIKICIELRQNYQKVNFVKKTRILTYLCLRTLKKDYRI